MERRWRETDSSWVREELGKLSGRRPVRSVHGYRLGRSAGGEDRASDISEVTDMSIWQGGRVVHAVAGQFASKKADIADRILKEINERLGFLNNVGLDT